MDFANLDALTPPELNIDPSPPPYRDEPTVTHAQQIASPPSPSSTRSILGPKKESGIRKRSKEDDDAALKRQRNTLAARKYRQKRLDRIQELEEALEDVKKERDELRIKLARQEAETEAMKLMMKLRMEMEK